MNNSINTDGVSFRLLQDGSLLITTSTGQHQIQPQGVADLYDLLCSSEGHFLNAAPDLPLWARGDERTIIGHRQIVEETPTWSLDAPREDS